MTTCRYRYNDGGAAAYFKDTCLPDDARGDCVLRAIALATGQEYGLTLQALQSYCVREPKRKGRSRSHPLGGVYRDTYEKYLTFLGWEFIPTMRVGSGTRVHLRQDELPPGTVIARLSKHVTCVRNGVILDIYNPARRGTRCVYGLFIEKGNPHESIQRRWDIRRYAGGGQGPVPERYWTLAAGRDSDHTRRAAGLDQRAAGFPVSAGSAPSPAPGYPGLC